MLNELLRRCWTCPVCGRILYRPLKDYWCPFCGHNLSADEQEDNLDLSVRITARDENGVPYYCGERGFRQRTYAHDMDINVVAEILEKLCQYEEIEVENDKIIDKLIESGNNEIEVIEDEG